MAKRTEPLVNDPVKSLNWLAMTTGYVMKDQTLLDKQAFFIEVVVKYLQQGPDYFIMSVK